MRTPLTPLAFGLTLALLAPLSPFAPAAPAHAADVTQPHEHKGILKAYPRPPPPLKLSDAEKTVIDEGRPVLRQSAGEDGGRGMAIFGVKASPDVVWATITDFASYPKWIPEVKKCEVYRARGGEVDVEFDVKTFPVELTYYIHHELDMANRWGTWTLDYGRQSDLDDSVGFWRVNPVPGKPDESVVEYSVDIAIKGWVPGFVREMLVEKGVQQATRWVKVQSEKKKRAVGQ